MFKVISLDSSEMQVELQRDLDQIAKQAIPPELLTNDSFASNPSPLLNLIDVCFVVDHHKFLCHKVNQH